MAALSSLSVSKTLSVVLTWPGLIPLPPAQQTGALSAELTRRQFCKVMRVKDTPKKWKWPDYSGTPLYGHLYIKDSFVCSDIKRSKFFSKINPLNTDTIACPVGVRINGVPLVLKAQRLVSYKKYIPPVLYVCKHRHFATRELLWFGPHLVMYEAEKYVFWDPSLLLFLFSV